MWNQLHIKMKHCLVKCYRTRSTLTVPVLTMNEPSTLAVKIYGNEKNWM
jgi:hypothetical protein